MLQRIRHALFRPIDIASLVAFRILFGALMLAGTVRFVAKGWVHDLYIQPDFFFSYYGFSWVEPWPAWGMYLHVAVMGLLALCIALGLFYRVSIALFFAAFTYVELIDQTNYLNHYYFISLVSLLMIFLPLHRAWSIDSWRRPGLRRDTVPAWVRYVLLGQIAVVYVFAGVAKLNPDWLFAAEPLRTWLQARSGMSLMGLLFDQAWVAYAMSWAGAAFDLTIVGWLLWHRTRPVAYVAVVGFHGMTGWLFNIGMFPWIMITATLLFFPPDWPRRWIRAFSGGKTVASPAPRNRPGSPRWMRRLGVALVAGYFAIQLLVPLRQHLYPGRAAWTGEGFNFAWNVMLVEKTGRVEFVVASRASDRVWTVEPADYLTPLQVKMMSTQPHLIQRFAHYLGRRFRARENEDVAVHARAYASLNGRRSRLLIDPSVDLIKQPISLRPKPWIRPLDLGTDTAAPAQAGSRLPPP
jgi:hypothetical protein